MPTLVASSTWSPSAAWPAGTQAGDVVLAVALQTDPSPIRAFVNAGWRLVASRAFDPGYKITDVYAQVFQRVVSAADLAGPAPSRLNFRQQLITLRGTLGVGVVQQGVRQGRVQPGGGLLVVSRTESPTGADLPAGLSWRLPPGTESGSRRGVPWAVRVAAGFVNAPAGGLVGSAEPFRQAFTLELLPPLGPLSPELLAPGAGEVAATGDIEFAWAHRASVQGGSQQAYRLSFSDGVDQWWWSASTGALVSSETDNASSVGSVEIPAGEFDAGVQYTWEVQTQEAVDGQWSPVSSSRSFTPVTPPSVVVTGPASTVSDDLTPTVSWVPTTPRGSQTAFRVQVVTALGAMVWDSRPQPGSATSFTLPVLDWVNGAGYKVLVSVQQTGGAWSARVERAFTISWSPPAEPAVSAVRVEGAPGVRVRVEGALDDQGPADYLVERIGPDGVWQAVTDWLHTDAGAVEFTDVFAHSGTPTNYRARAATVLDGVPLHSDWSMGEPVVNTDTGCYLASAFDPVRTWVPAHPRSSEQRELAEVVSVTYGLGDSHGRVARGPIQGQRGTLAVAYDSEGTRSGVLDLLRAGEPLLWRRNVPTSATTSVSEVLTMARAGTIGYGRLSGAITELGTVTFPWIEQEPQAPGQPTTAPITHEIEGVD